MKMGLRATVASFDLYQSNQRYVVEPAFKEPEGGINPVLLDEKQALLD